MNHYSELIVDSDIQSRVEAIVASDTSVQFVTRVCEGEFLIEDAMFAIEKAHISSDKLKCIVLAAPKFSTISQNKLLKVIEEPPKNIIFKIIVASKTMILPTILSRLPVQVSHSKNKTNEHDIKNFGLEYIYTYLSQAKGTSADEAKAYIESLCKEAFVSKEFRFKQSDFDAIEKCVKLLDVGSPVIFVLNSALLILLGVKTRTLHENKKS
jgi:DNA polymerase-3 subunit delta'